MILEVFSGLKAYSRNRVDRKLVCNLLIHGPILQYKDIIFVGGEINLIMIQIFSQQMTLFAHHYEE